MEGQEISLNTLWGRLQTDNEWWQLANNKTNTKWQTTILQCTINNNNECKLSTKDKLLSHRVSLCGWMDQGCPGFLFSILKPPFGFLLDFLFFFHFFHFGKQDNVVQKIKKFLQAHTDCSKCRSKGGHPTLGEFKICTLKYFHLFPCCVNFCCCEVILGEKHSKPNSSGWNNLLILELIEWLCACAHVSHCTLGLLHQSITWWKYQNLTSGHWWKIPHIFAGTSCMQQSRFVIQSLFVVKSQRVTRWS